MLKVAVLSRWHVHADEYAGKFQKREDVTLTVMWDEEPEKGKAFAEKYGMEFEPDLDKLLARDDVDAVCINAPTNMHRDVMVKAARAGKHIFTEKVMALTAAEGADIRAAIEEKGVKFVISFPHRTAPKNLLAKKVLDEKLLGKVTYFRMRNAHNGASANWLPPHFYSQEQCGGGAMIDLGAHPMYLTAWLMGKPAEISSAFTHVTGREVEDNAVCVMKYPCGAIAVSETGFVTGRSPQILEIHGTEGSIILTNDDVRFSSSLAEAAPKLPDPLPDAITQFAEAILHGKEIIFGLDDAIVLTEIMEAAYKAHKQGGFVAV